MEFILDSSLNEDEMRDKIEKALKIMIEMSANLNFIRLEMTAIEKIC
jgi:hypothetical protein